MSSSRLMLLASAMLLYIPLMGKELSSLSCAEKAEICEINLGNGKASLRIELDDALYYDVISELTSLL